MGNSLNRSMLKKQYERFCTAWNNEKRYQKFLEDSKRPLPEGTHKLGRKPTFNMWLQAQRNKQIAAEGTVPAPQQDPKQVEVKNTDWE